MVSHSLCTREWLFFLQKALSGKRGSPTRYCQIQKYPERFLAGVLMPSLGRKLHGSAFG